MNPDLGCSEVNDSIIRVLWVRRRGFEQCSKFSRKFSRESIP